MPTEVLIPKLGMTMTEGTVAEWLVPDGGSVRQGEIVYRLETEKINFEVEAESDGVLRHAAAEGATLAPGSVVGYILAPGEALPSGIAATPAVSASASAATVPTATAPPRIAAAGTNGRVVASPIARRLAKEAGIALHAIAGSGPGGRITEQDVLAAKSRTPQPAAARAPAQPPREIVASPLARKMAEQLRIDLASVTGTGPGGRITKEDVEQAAAAAPTRTPAVASAA